MRTLWLILGLYFCCSLNLEAHPISISWAEAQVGKSKTTVRLRILAEDLYLYHQLQPDARDKISLDALYSAAQKHKLFLQKYFFIRDEQGNKLEAKFVKTDLSNLSIEGIEVSNLMEYSVYYVLEYTHRQPRQFAFYQQFGGAHSPYNALMLLTVTTEGSQDKQTVELGREKPYIHSFDWSESPGKKPGLFQSDLPVENQHSLLGIGSYSALHSFLYVQTFEVRHEILIPFATLETWISVERKDDLFLEVEEQQKAEDAIGRFFKGICRVEINGREISATVHRVDFYGLDFRDFAQLAPRKRLNIAHARVGVILTFPVDLPVNQVRVNWKEFNFQIRKLNMTVYTYEQTFQKKLTRYQPVLQWKNDRALAVPKVKAVHVANNDSWLGWLSSSGLPPEKAEAAAATLLKNLYQAFAHRSENAIYESLSQTATGGALTEVYLQIKKGLAMQEQGGALVSIRKMDIQESELLNAKKEAFTVRLSWTVSGRVEHWGHMHDRENLYEGKISVKNEEGYWKIDKLQVLSEERLRFQTSLRK
ncbi:hypothetical protein AAG747_22240 [Rapidithrix thailandica]|uniref:Uncharacterized protein n=1 Tax=Rapidithrix thailandica TaxID=413964 RepID=A0AAW9SIY6_9BACT